MIRLCVSGQRGFSLIELLVVVAIIGATLSLALPMYDRSIERAAIAAHNANVRILQNAATVGVVVHGAPDYPVTWSAEDSDPWPDHDSWRKYIQKWPELPQRLETGPGGHWDEDVSDEYIVQIDQNRQISVKPAFIREE